MQQDHCPDCGIQIIYGQRGHITVWDCREALRREVDRLRRVVEAQRVCLADLEFAARAAKVAEAEA